MWNCPWHEVSRTLQDAIKCATNPMLSPSRAEWPSTVSSSATKWTSRNDHPQCTFYTVPCAAAAAAVYVFLTTNLPSQMELVAATVRPVHPLVLLVLVPSHHNLPTGPSALSRPPRSLRTATQLIPGSRTRAGDSCELSRGRRELATPITPPQPPNCNHLHCRDLVLCARNFYAVNQMKIKLRFIGTI